MSLSPQVCKKNYKVHIPSLGEECEFWLVRVTDEQSISNPDKDHAYYTDDGKLFIYDGKNLVRVNCDICFTQEEREKLEDIEEGANKYVLPVAKDSSLGGIKTGFTQTEKQYAVEVTEEGQAYVTVPWTDTIYTLPEADADTLGGVKLGYSQNDKNYPVLKDSEGNIYVAVPWVEYQLQQASAENLGGIKTGYEQQGQNYPVLVDVNGNAYVTVPWNEGGTSYYPATDQQLGLLMLGHQYTLGDFPLVFDSESRAYTQLPFSNPNLLDNADFKSGIINQRGQDSYTGSASKNVYTVDRWSINKNTANTLSVEEGYISCTLADNGLLTQYIDSEISGAITCAIKLKDEDLKVVTVSEYSSENEWESLIYDFGELETGLNVKVVKDVSTTNKWRLGFQNLSGSNKTLNIEYIKLEKGSVFTGMPQWNKIEELNKCLYYFERLAGSWQNSYVVRSDANGICIFVPCSPKAKPPSLVIVNEVNQEQDIKIYKMDGSNDTLMFEEYYKTYMQGQNGVNIWFNRRTGQTGIITGVACMSNDFGLDAET